MTAGVGDAVPAVGVPEQGAAVIVCTFEADTGSVPVSVAAHKENDEKVVAPRFIVLPPVALPAISAVI